mmetsp:Transcript_58735/g.136643  ORF Transcript_58735/g.136643 Transcript_58735/m.136643 type:complete len:208 (+) Transcript_58735:122-745(+)
MHLLQSAAVCVCQALEAVELCLHLQLDPAGKGQSRRSMGCHLLIETLARLQAFPVPLSLRATTTLIQELHQETTLSFDPCGQVASLSQAHSLAVQALDERLLLLHLLLALRELLAELLQMCLSLREPLARLLQAPVLQIQLPHDAPGLFAAHREPPLPYAGMPLLLLVLGVLLPQPPHLIVQLLGCAARPLGRHGTRLLLRIADQQQ